MGCSTIPSSATSALRPPRAAAATTAVTTTATSATTTAATTTPAPAKCGRGLPGCRHELFNNLKKIKRIFIHLEKHLEFFFENFD
jgi:hypothetical protein